MTSTHYPVHFQVVSITEIYFMQDQDCGKGDRLGGTDLLI